MNRFMLFILSTTVLTHVAHAADLPSVKGLPLASEAQEASWEGLYFGLNYGSAWGTTDWSNPTGAYLLANTPRFPASSAQGGIFGGITLGYNHQVGPYVLGVEGDVDATSLHGNAVCGGIFGTPEQPKGAPPDKKYDPGTGWACKSAPATLATLDARAGYALGGVLLFAKGGLAYANEKLGIGAAGAGASNPSVAFSQDNWGFNVGAGVEYALGGGWSAKAEYDFYGFGKRSFSTTDGLFGTSYGAAVSQNISVAKFGLNRHWGAGDQNFAPATGLLSYLSGEIGARVGWGGGRYRFDLFSPSNASNMISRLTWPASGVMTEAFGRVDAPMGLYLKGFMGGIAFGDGGTMHDEDFVPVVDSYSNTVSTTKNGSDLYGAIDLGYAYHGGNWRLGPFVGYTYLQDRQNAYGCVQIAANPDNCSQAGVNPPYTVANQLILSRFDNWNAVRLGLAGDVMLTDRFKLAVDAAWLPYANAGGSVDNHWHRAGVNPWPDHGHGSGYQLEAVLSYLVTDRISVGAGARYWNISANGADQLPGLEQPTKVYVDRTMVFGQVSYAFGSPAAPEVVAAKF